MDYGVPDSSGTDDDLPPSQQNRVPKLGRAVGNRRSIVGPDTFSRMYTDMQSLIHQLEQEAYSAVLRAFKAQSDAITWEKEGLITELRKELRVSDDEHRELLTKVNGDDVIRRIREWRQAGGHQDARFTASQPVHDVLNSPISASRKKQKTSQMGQMLSGFPSMKSIQYHPTGPIGNRRSRSSSGVAHNESADVTTYDPLIGKRVWTRWPADNSFYEAVITKYNPAEGRHALVYYINTENESWEWVDLKEIPPDDIRWEGEDPGISYHGRRGGSDTAVKTMNRGRGITKDQSKFLPMQNGSGKTVSDDIELLNTETLVKEVEKVFGVSHPDPLELEKAKKMLKEHEQSLIEAIARLAGASDGESDGERQFLHGQAMDG